MTTRFFVPRINANDDRVEIVHWHVEHGAFVTAGKELVDIETTKATVTLGAEMQGFVRPLVAQGTVVVVGTPLYVIANCLEELDGCATDPVVDATGPSHQSENRVAASGLSSEPAAYASRLAETIRTAVPLPPGVGYSVTRFTKEAAQLLLERRLSSEDFPNAGLVTAKALRARLNGPDTTKTVEGSSAPLAWNVPPDRPVRSVRMSLAKQAEAASLALGQSGNITSTLTVGFESAVIRDCLSKQRLFVGSLLPVILYETAQLLTGYPYLTAWCHEDIVHYYDAVDLGVALDLGKGLKVVTFRNAPALTAIEFFEKTVDAGQRYLRNRLKPEELTNSTFTVTDLSNLDVLHFRPLINGRQSAILGVGGDSAQVGHPMTLSLTFDHRVVSGREAAGFLGKLKSRLNICAARPDPG